MSDEQLIDAVAGLWVDGGGDAEGMDWCLAKIKERINELRIEERVHELIEEGLTRGD